jgi:hypothetical protein
MHARSHGMGAAAHWQRSAPATIAIPIRHDNAPFSIRAAQVQRSAPAFDFGAAGEVVRAGVQPGAVPSDPDAGNVLMLEPR